MLIRYTGPVSWRVCRKWWYRPVTGNQSKSVISYGELRRQSPTCTWQNMLQRDAGQPLFTSMWWSIVMNTFMLLGNLGSWSGKGKGREEKAERIEMWEDRRKKDEKEKKEVRNWEQCRWRQKREKEQRNVKGINKQRKVGVEKWESKLKGREWKRRWKL
jgi:hypothetical protein